MSQYGHTTFRCLNNYFCVTVVLGYVYIQIMPMFEDKCY